MDFEQMAINYYNNFEVLKENGLAILTLMRLFEKISAESYNAKVGKEFFR